MRHEDNRTSHVHQLTAPGAAILPARCAQPLQISAGAVFPSIRVHGDGQIAPRAMTAKSANHVMKGQTMRSILATGAQCRLANRILGYSPAGVLSCVVMLGVPLWGQATNVFPASGDAGIGTTTPYYPLHVSSYDNGSPSLTYHSGSTMFGLDVPYNVELAFGWLGAAPYGYWIQARSDVSTAQPISLNPLGGNVGIGTINPTSVLTVNGQMFFPANNAQSWDPGNGSGSGLRLGYSLTSDFAYIVANNTGVAPKNLVLQPDGGNVGIGTTNPQHMLHVAGTIGAEEVVITSTGADYVFGPDYRLQPLNEVKAYIGASPSPRHPLRSRRQGEGHRRRRHADQASGQNRGAYSPRDSG